MYTLRIKITKDLLEQSKGCRYQGDSCVFARAFRDFFPKATVNYTAIFPFDTYAEPIDKSIAENRAFATTSEIEDYIYKFDGSHPDEIPNLPEAEFDLPIPDWVLNRINIDELKPLLASHPNLSLVTK